MRACQKRPFRALQIWHKSNNIGAGSVYRRAHNIRGIGHLRQQAWRNKRANFNFWQPGCGERLHPAIFCAAGIMRVMLCKPSRGPTSLTIISRCCIGILSLAIMSIHTSVITDFSAMRNDQRACAPDRPINPFKRQAPQKSRPLGGCYGRSERI